MTNHQDPTLPVPERSRLDAGHALVKAVLASVPVLGHAAAELFEYIVQPPIERRREEWMREVGASLASLERKGLDVTQLGANEQFVSAVLQITQSALRTHLDEKRAALRNAVLNLASGHSAEDTRLHLLLTFLDELTPAHLAILSVFSSPTPPPTMSIGGLDSVLEYNIPHLRGQRELYDQLWRDLYTRGLLNTENMHVTMSAAGLASRRTTGLGNSLLALIAQPADEA